MEGQYKILVKTTNVMVYNYVQGYEIIDGHVTFTDPRTHKVKRFPVQDTVIEEN